MREFGRSEPRWGEEDLDEYEDDGAEGYGRYEDGYELGDEEEGGEEDEYEEAEEEPPAQDEMEYMSIREKLKEKIRQRVRKENGAALGKSGSSADKRAAAAAANKEFGSFFGPSKPAISRRVIEERHALLETQHIRSKKPSSASDNKRVAGSSGNEEKSNISNERPKIVKAIISKAQALKDMRDYSFLFDDDTDLPDPTKEKEHKKPSAHSDVRSVETPRPKVPATKPPVSAPIVRDKKLASHVQARMQTPVNGLKPTPSNPRNLPGGNVGNGPSRPSIQKVASSSSPHASSTMKKPGATINNKPDSMERKLSALKPDSSQKRVPDTRESRELPKSKVTGQQASSSRPQLPSSRPQLPSSSRPQLPSSRPQQPSSRLQQPTSSSRTPQPPLSSRSQQLTSSSRPQQPSSSKASQLTSSSRPQQKVPSRPQLQTGSRPQQTSSLKPQQQMVSRPHQSTSSKSAYNVPSSKVQSSSSKPQMSKPFKPMTQQRLQDNHLKKRPASRYSDESEDEDAKALSMLRRLTGYNPRRFRDDDDDVSDMEATFDDIMDEEYRSEQIAREEDEEQLRLIQQEEEEERRRMMRKMAKKRKLR